MCVCVCVCVYLCINVFLYLEFVIDKYNYLLLYNYTIYKKFK